MSNGLDPDQARRSVGPDLGPNCLQRLLADKNIINYQIRRRIRTYGESGLIAKEIKERNEIEERNDIVERNVYFLVQ